MSRISGSIQICVEPGDAKLPEISHLSVQEALDVARNEKVIAVPVQSISKLKEIHRNQPSATVAFRTEKRDFSTVNLRPTWFQFDGRPLLPARAASLPGSDAHSILAELGYSDKEIDALVTEGVVGRTLWAKT